MAVQRKHTDQENRAVSPVIGVILMVAITVILAAVIGAFVLEIGDQQETAPNTSFSSDEQVVYIQGKNNFQANITTVDITHAGGNTIDITQASLKVNGANTVIGFDDEDLADINYDTVRLQPDISQSAGSNDVVEFSSGQTWNVAAYGHDDGDPTAYEVLSDLPNGYPPVVHTGPISKNNEPCLNVQDGNGQNAYKMLSKSSGPQCKHWRPRILGDDTVSVVWTAESGGKTQTLFKYDVQTGSPEP
jgi:flagellin-like protein